MVKSSRSAYFYQLVSDQVLNIIISISRQPAMKGAKAIIILALVGCCFRQVLANAGEPAAASNLANYYGRDLSWFGFWHVPHWPLMPPPQSARPWPCPWRALPPMPSSFKWPHPHPFWALPPKPGAAVQHPYSNTKA